MSKFYDVEVNRQSVCLGDDMNSHNITLNIPEDISLNDYISTLEKQNFFAHVAGNNVAWLLTINHAEIATYYTKSSRIVTIDEKSWQIQKHLFPHYFKYYSPIEKRLYCIQDKRIPIIKGLIEEIEHIIKIK